jgi:hypothetical protein
MPSADLAAWAAALFAGAAAYVALRQVRIAKQQLAESTQAAREDDSRQRNRMAIELAQEWCRTEAASAIAILRESLIGCTAVRLRLC